jgi:hypothetical protein
MNNAKKKAELKAELKEQEATYAEMAKVSVKELAKSLDLSKLDGA